MRGNGFIDTPLPQTVSTPRFRLTLHQPRHCSSRLLSSERPPFRRSRSFRTSSNLSRAVSSTGSSSLRASTSPRTTGPERAPSSLHLSHSPRRCTSTFRTNPSYGTSRQGPSTDLRLSAKPPDASRESLPEDLPISNDVLSALETLDMNDSSVAVSTPLMTITTPSWFPDTRMATHPSPLSSWHPCDDAHRLCIQLHHTAHPQSFDKQRSSHWTRTRTPLRICFPRPE